MQETKSNENRYLNGKIYTIRSFQTDKYYIGSTCTPLNKRLYKHRSAYNSGNSRITSRKIVQFNDNYIELLEEFPCDNKMQLSKREGELIRLYMDSVVNIQIAGRTKQEYHIDNREHLLEKVKNYYSENIEHVKEYKKEYHVKNNEALLLKAREYREHNRDVINAKRREKILCDCGMEINIYTKSKHLTSKYHIAKINQI
jgi:hypothetical protein